MINHQLNNNIDNFFVFSVLNYYWKRRLFSIMIKRISMDLSVSILFFSKVNIEKYFYRIILHIKKQNCSNKLEVNLY